MNRTSCVRLAQALGVGENLRQQRINEIRRDRPRICLRAHPRLSGPRSYTGCGVLFRRLDHMRVSRRPDPEVPTMTNELSALVEAAGEAVERLAITPAESLHAAISRRVFRAVGPASPPTRTIQIGGGKA